MKYFQYKPIHPKLISHIEYYNSLVGDEVQDQSFISLPEGKVGIVFMLNGTDTIDTGKEILERKQTHIHGLSQCKTIVSTSADIHTFSVVFKPSGLYHFLPAIPVHELVKFYVNVEDVFGADIHRTIDNLKACSTDLERVLVIEAFLLKNQQSPNDRVEEAIREIVLSKGDIRVESVANSINMSKRQLQNIFKNRIGLSPKQFIKLTRFKNVLDNFPKRNITMSSYANQLGYYDESHFIHEFKLLTEMTPSKFFNDNSITSDFYNFRRILVQ